VAHDLGPSRKQIRKAGKVLRAWWTAPDEPPITPEATNAYSLVRDYRATCQRPLNKVTIQLRRFVSAEVEGPVIVAQRLKRMPTILDKLGRHPAMDLTRMQDIGGCRAILESPDAVQAVLQRIVRHWHVERVFDYVESPKESGYRAIHVAVPRNDRMIEIQLRTPAQQSWAATVERVGARLGQSVKDGEGPDDLLQFFRVLGRMIGLEESGQTVDDATVAEFNILSEQVRGLIARNP
jgi:putative GTP pyrophosphokinase